MRLVSLHIKRMPGFKEKGFSYSKGILQPGINVILGSNGAGKTTTCLAVRKLFFPQHPSVIEYAPVSLQAQVEDSGKIFDLDVEGARYLSIPIIPLPKMQDAHCYTLLLDDLFDATDIDFAHAISKMAFGGCDLQQLKESFFLAPRWGHKERKHLYEKKRILEKIALDHQELHNEEATLKELANRVLEAKKAKELLEKIKIVHELNQKKTALRGIEFALSELDPGVAWAREEDLLIYREICAKESKDLPTEVIEDFQFLILEESVKELQELERELREEKRRALELQTDIKERCSLLEVEKGNFPCIQISKVAEMQRLWEKWHEKRCAITESETRLKILSPDQEVSFSTDTLREGIHLLGCFVKEEDQKWLRLLLFCSPLLCFFLYHHPYLCAGTVLFSCVVLYLLRNSSSSAYKRAFLKLGLPVPSDWTIEEVNQHRVRLEAMWGETVRRLNDKETAQIIGIQKNLYKEEADSLYRDLQTAGFDHSKLSWIPFLHGLQRAQDLFFEMKKQEAKVSDAENRRQTLFCTIGVTTLQQAVHRLTQAQKARELASELKRVKERKQEILTRCKIEGEDQEQALIRCVAGHKNYLKYSKEKVVLEAALREKEEAVKSYPELLTLSLSDLHEYEESLRGQAALHDSLLQKIAAIEQKMEIISARDVFIKADAEKRQAESALNKAQEEFVYKAMGAFLLEKAEQLYARDFQPEVLQKASEWFLRFTCGMHSLHLSQKGFAAFNVKTEQFHELQELSRGTRIQLILAIRLAFMEHAEKEGTKLPLLLDEVLSHADDERFSYMVEALKEVAYSGRQIFYFTCQTGCVEAWVRLIHDVNIIDLDKLKQESACILTPLQEIKENPLPAPCNKSLHTYALELNVPGLDVNEPPSAWHLGHFVNSAEELHQLLLQKMHFYGQFKHLSEKGVAMDPKIEAKGKLAEHYFSLAQRGKGKKITYEDLEKGGVSDKFLDKTLECAKRCDYDAAKLLTALEDKQVPGFREKTREDLEIYFIENGHLDLREPLDAATIRAHLWTYLYEITPTLSSEEAVLFINTLCN